MEYSVRANSFISQGYNVIQTIDEVGKIDGINYIDLNYPEHFGENSKEEISDAIMRNTLKLNAVSLRFTKKFINGAFNSHDKDLRNEAINICKRGIDLCEYLSGNHTIVWLAYEGNDYPFQVDYIDCWIRIKEIFQEICDYKNIPICIEYKPYEERVHSFLDSFGTTMLMVKDVDRKNLGVNVDFCHMLMKKENPSFVLSYLLNAGKLFGIHLNDGEGHTDEGMMVGMSFFWKIFEFIFYLKKYKYQGVVFFDTFPIRENAAEECRCNVEMCNKIESIIDEIGLETIQNIVDKNDGIAVNRLFQKILK